MSLSTNKSPLHYMLAHGFFVILWNVAGVLLLSQGKSALGPTASWLSVGLFAVFMVIYWMTYHKGHLKTFIIFAGIGSLLGFSAIYGAFTKDPALWPSEFWRYAGVAVNSLAIIGFAFALKYCFKK